LRRIPDKNEVRIRQAGAEFTDNPVQMPPKQAVDRVTTLQPTRCRLSRRPSQVASAGRTKCSRSSL